MQGLKRKQLALSVSTNTNSINSGGSSSSSSGAGGDKTCADKLLADNMISAGSGMDTSMSPVASKSPKWVNCVRFAFPDIACVMLRCQFASIGQLSTPVAKTVIFSSSCFIELCFV